jgi:methyl-accepting chemotaxis protein
MRTLTLRFSLLAIVFSLVAAVAGSLAYSLWSMSDMAADEHQLTQQVIPTVSLSGEIGADLMRRHLYLNQHVNSSDPAAKRQLETDINAQSARIDELRNKLGELLVQAETRQALRSFEELTTSYFTGMQKVLAQSNANDAAAALQTLREMRASVAQMDKLLTGLAKQVEKRAHEMSAEAESHYRTNIIVLAAIGLVAALVAVGSVFFVLRRVLSPIAATTGSMETLAGGDLGARISFTERPDEIGKMARALQIFQQNLLKVRELEEAEKAAAAARLARAQSMESVVSDVGEVVAAAAAGDFSARLQIDHADEQMQKLVAGINEINSVVDSATNEFSGALQAIAGGDLTARIETRYHGKFAELKGAINETVERLSATVRTIQMTSADVGIAAREINMGADDLSKRTEEQASSLEETAATTEELAASVKASAQASREAAAIADQAMQAAQAGGTIAGEAVEAMARIETASQKISEIIRVIDDIAFQTNLLALNAAVEAARAGDAGKGFAVVASEVRTLAQRSGAAAKDISGLISSSNAEVGAGVKLVRQAGEALTRIQEASQKVAATIADISAASGEQANGIDEMSQAVAHLDEMTQANAALAEQSAASANALSGRIGQLNDLVAAFRTEDDAPAGAGSAGTEPQRLRQLAEAAFSRPKQPGATRTPSARRPAPAPAPAPAAGRKVANSRDGDSGWEEF